MDLITQYFYHNSATYNIDLYEIWNVLTGIFEKHKLLFSFQMTIKLQQSHGIVTQEEVDFFIKGSATSISSENVSPAPWITAQVS